MSFTKVSVLVPTRMRPRRLETLLESFEQTVPQDNAELVFRIDEDDVWSQTFLADYPMVVGPRGGGYADMPKFYNELAARASGDVLMCGNDDMVFKTVGWVSILLKEASIYSDGIFNLGVKTHNETHYPFSTVSRILVDTLGFIWDPKIFWGDIYLRDIMAWYARNVMVRAVEIDHDWAGKNPDQTFRETRAPKARVEGSRTYWDIVHRPAVLDAIEKLKVLVVQNEVAS